MKLLAINASHRGDRGHTHLLIDRIFRGAREAGATCEVAALAEHNINRCLSCHQCQRDDHLLRCVYDGKDDVRMILRKMADADVLIYGTPIYLYSMTGLLKTFLDRLFGTGNVRDVMLSDCGLLHHHIDETVCSKPFVALVVCAGLEEETPRNVLSYFRTYARFMNAPRVGTLVRNAADLLGFGQYPERENPRIRAVYQAYEQAGRELATSARIRRSTQRRANQEIVAVPLFRLLKRFRPFKSKIVDHARSITGTLYADLKRSQ